MDFKEMMEATLEKRNKAHKAMMDLLQTAAEEKRSLGGEEDEQFSRMEKDFDQAQAELRRIEAMEQRAANMVSTQKTVAQDVAGDDLLATVYEDGKLSAIDGPSIIHRASL